MLVFFFHFSIILASLCIKNQNLMEEKACLESICGGLC